MFVCVNSKDFAGIHVASTLVAGLVVHLCISGQEPPKLTW